MAEKVKSLIKVLVNETNKHRLFNNATTKINSATGKAQEKLNNLQNAIVAKYDVIAKQVNSDITVIQNLNATQLEPNPLPKRVIKWWQWYQQLTGLDTVELAKQQVITAQNILFKCQDERRMLTREAIIINEKLKEVYSELIQTKRDDPKYVQLTIIENKSLQDHAKIVSQLNLLEKDEKDHFTLLATAIKEYHDSQTMNAQKYKYLSILASAILAIVSLTASMIYNNRRIANMRNVIIEAQKKNESLLQGIFKALENTIDTRFSNLQQQLNSNAEQKVPVTTEIVDRSFPIQMQNAFVVLGICLVGMYICRALID